MKTETHLKYAYYLKEKYLSFCSSYDKGALVWGCVEPDVNLFSYLKGFRIKPFYGHNRENTTRYISKTVLKSENGQIGCFGLGRLVHYVCDAFTLPHNQLFICNMKEHNQYEKRLHYILTDMYSDDRPIKYRNISSGGLNHELSVLCDRYYRSVHSEVNDAEFIISAVNSVMTAWVSGVQNRMSTLKKPHSLN